MVSNSIFHSSFSVNLFSCELFTQVSLNYFFRRFAEYPPDISLGSLPVIVLIQKLALGK